MAKRNASFRLVIETEGAAFHPIDASFPLAEAEELGDIMTRVTTKLREGERSGVVRDFNGNTVGTWRLS